MKTKEAIEILENLYSIPYSDSSLINSMQAMDIKTLLQQGEKYKKVVEELESCEKDNDDPYCHTYLMIDDKSYVLEEAIEYLKRKYK